MDEEFSLAHAGIRATCDVRKYFDTDRVPWPHLETRSVGSTRAQLLAVYRPGSDAQAERHQESPFAAQGVPSSDVFIRLVDQPATDRSLEPFGPASVLRTSASGGAHRAGLHAAPVPQLRPKALVFLPGAERGSRIWLGLGAAFIKV